MAENAKAGELIDVVVRLPWSMIKDHIHVGAHQWPDGMAARLAVAKALLACRRRRQRIFPGVQFVDPAWDMMLELYVAGAEGKQFRVSKLCIQTDGSSSTATRHRQSLEAKGFISRVEDPEDGRSSFAVMEPKLKIAMDDWLSSFLEMVMFADELAPISIGRVQA